MRTLPYGVKLLNLNEGCDSVEKEWEHKSRREEQSRPGGEDDSRTILARSSENGVRKNRTSTSKAMLFGVVPARISCTSLAYLSIAAKRIY